MGRVYLENKIKQELKITQSIAQSLDVLAMPTEELSLWLEARIEENPYLKKEEEQFEQEVFAEDDPFALLDKLDPLFREAIFDEVESDQKEVVQEETFLEFLERQAREVVLDCDRLKKVCEILGNLDERGFFVEEIEDLSLLKIVQQFDPPGVGARDVQEALLLQLERQGKKGAMVYQVVKHSFSFLLEGNVKELSSRYGLSREEIRKMVCKEILSLQFYPAAAWRKLFATPIQPDVSIVVLGEGVVFELHQEALSLDHELQGKSFAKREAKMILHALKRRGETLLKVSETIFRFQEEFFRGKVPFLKPLSLDNIAKEISIHPSTVCRAVQGKWLSTPVGVIAFSSLFTQKIGSGKASADKAKRLIQEILSSKEGSNYSDRQLVTLLAEKEVICSRRVIAKYRKQLHLASKYGRKKITDCA